MSKPPTRSIRGYETATFDGASAPPPYQFEDQAAHPPTTRPEIRGSVILNEQQVRAALLKFAHENCCYGKDPAAHCKLHQIEPACAYHYTLETYTEKRDTAWKFEPYDARLPIDGAMNGVAPMPWQVQVFNEMPAYTDGKITTRVPHTASLSTCHKCNGWGQCDCRKCSGNGKVKCHFHSSLSSVSCHKCDGSGWNACETCRSSGKDTCELCKGNKQLVYYVELTVTMKNHKEHFVLDKTRLSTLPWPLVQGAPGQICYEEAGPRIWPMSSQFPEPQVVAASRRLVEQHSGAFPGELIHRQRQSVRVIPVSRVFCTYEQEDKQFYIYGVDNKVYFPDYYSQCGGCCTIL